MNGYHKYKICIDACTACAAFCNHFASSCTEEEDVKMMATCIQLDMECAVACGEECGKHHTKHFQECAAACKACAKECRTMAA